MPTVSYETLNDFRHDFVAIQCKAEFVKRESYKAGMIEAARMMETILGDLGKIENKILSWGITKKKGQKSWRYLEDSSSGQLSVERGSTFCLKQESLNER